MFAFADRGVRLFTDALLRDVFRTPAFVSQNDNPALHPLASATAAADRFRHLSVLLIVAAASLALVLDFVFRVRVDSSGTSMIELSLAALLLLSQIWRVRRQRIADAVGTMGLAAMGGLCCGAIAMLELRLGFPKADDLLHRADLALGLDAVQVASAVARRPYFLYAILAPIYEHTLGLFFSSLVVLSLLNDRIEAWRAAFNFVGTLLTTCVVAAFIPATGLVNWASPELMEHLPRFFLSHFNEFYLSADPVLRLQVIDGVITFPSFHAVVGFLVLSMWRKRRVTRIVAAAWLVLELLSTVSGGHYVIDLIGGFAVWGAWFALSRRIEGRAAIGPKLSAACSSAREAEVLPLA